MASNRLPLRLVVLVVLAIGIAAFIGLAVGTVNGVLELAERVSALPWYARLPLLVVGAAALAAVGLLAWKLLRPASRRHPRRDPATLPSRPEIEARIADLRARSAEAVSLEDELVELDRRRREGDCHVAVFGEISTGKSSLVRALAPTAATDIDVIGGTTRQVHHFRGELPDGRMLVLADVPGSGEVDGSHREQLARDEALRAHAVVYVAASDLTRAQSAELAWLAGFGKPLVLVLNKIDQYDARERTALLERFRERHGRLVQAVVAAAAGGLERFERSLPDGSR
ncbi:MAG: 50S ribosome-binding GTPase, partial [Xanthomonadales bacterium]|nr:50S ribosome-binding GTPase [Xanthomonadales bacterium]